MAPKQPENDLLLTAVSIGVFVGTTLLSQWLKYKSISPNARAADGGGRRRASTGDSENSLSWVPSTRDDESGDDSPIVVDQWHSREMYHRRRHRERLSFGNAMDLAPSYSVDDDEVAEQDEGNVSQASSSPRAVEGFLPKNSNWNHFELYHRRECTATDISIGTDKIHLEGSDISSKSFNEMDETNLDSEDVSLTSNDHFVWTNAYFSPKAPSQRKTLPTANLSEQPPPPFEPKIDFSALHRVKKEYKSADSPTSFLHTPTQVLDHRESDKQPPASCPPPPPPPPPPGVKRSHTFSSSDLPRIAEAITRQHSLPLESALLANHHHVVTKLQNRAARAHYNAKIMPQKLVMLRHGQSMGNIDETMYSTTPDNAMPLTELGWEQARAAGRHLKNKVLDHPDRVHFIVSPYVRTVETFHGIMSAWCDPAEFSHIANRDQRLKAWYGKLLELGLTWQEDPRIREQDFGNYQQPAEVKKYKRERAQFGAFYYRFPHGESGSDVFDRVSTFLDSLWRSFDMNKSRHYVLVTHGISIRVFLTRYFRYTIDQFHLLSNPRNCEMVVLEHDNQGRLEFAGRHELELENSEDNHQDSSSSKQRVWKYTKHKRLRVLPSEWVQRAQIRISFDEEIMDADDNNNNLKQEY